MISHISQKTGKIKVMVGLSGGVDSAISAALLKRAGYDVTGVFIKVWQPEWIECTWKKERRDAMRVAAHLGIPFITLNLEKEYKQGVIDYMIREYSLGRTPNPDVMCNREVKFGAFAKWAQAQGAKFVATGHYAQVINERMLAGVDKNKDQSYFLWTLTSKDLEHVLFPVGHLTKPEVRKLANKFKLPNATKKDSQGLCFIGKVDLKEFLMHYVESKSGNVLDPHGEIIGKHPGALLFTIGERHGFTINKKTPDDMPYYVIDKDIEQNTITVSNAESKAQNGNNLVRITHVNWIRGEPPFVDLPSQSLSTVVFPLKARSRYRETLQNIRIKAINIAETVIEFENSQETLTPGQSLVIYDGEECLGGGVIN